MINDTLNKLIKPGVSDIHFKAHEPPHVRERGRLVPLGTKAFELAELEALVKELLSDAQIELFSKSGNIDVAFNLDGKGRLRVNIYRQRGSPAFAIRIIPPTIQSFSDLNLPKETLEKMSRISRGLILISGVTGAGKTTTLNALLNYMNDQFSYNIVTIEDPIEYTHAMKKSSVSQREVGRDVASFDEGMRTVLRQDPDVIVLGEMRTAETFRAAIEAASTGHLVLATLHSSDTFDALDRIVNAFEFQQQTYLRKLLTNALKAIISQRLVQDKYGTNCFPTTEVMFATLQIKQMLYEGNVPETKALIEKGNAYGMHTFDQDLYRMVDEGIISPQEALNNASYQNDLRIKLQGQSGGAIEIVK